MAFNKIGHAYLKNGEETWVWVYFADVPEEPKVEPTPMFVDRKAQWIMADPDSPGDWGVFGTFELEVYGFRKRLWHADFNILNYSYHCVVKNAGLDTWFSLQGGGNA